MARKRKTLVSTSKHYFNPNGLKSLRKHKPYSRYVHTSRKHASRSQVSTKLGIAAEQLTRYEADPAETQYSQVPGLKALKKICLYYQIDPMMLMNLAFIPSTCLSGEDLVIDPESNYKQVIDFCPECGAVKLTDDGEYIKKAEQLAIRINVKRGLK